MKKIVLLLTSLLILTSSLFADDSDLDKVFSSLTSNKVTAGDFEQIKTSAKLKKPVKSSGTFVFCDEGVIWRTVKPFFSVMAVSKTSIVQVKRDGTKTVTDGSSNEVFKSIAQTLSALFSGSRESLESSFNIEKFELKSSSWSMILTPKDKTISQAIKKIQLSGNSTQTSKSLDEIKIFQGEKDSTAYVLSNQTYRQELTDNEKSYFN